MTPVDVLRRIVTTLGLTVVGVAAFTLSFDSQTKLARSAGVPDDLAAYYPACVDVAVSVALLIVIWVPGLSKGRKIYIWIAVGIWGAIQILGNALHIVALPPGEVTTDFAIALGVNSVPAITFFMIVHIAFMTVFRSDAAPKASVRTAKATKVASSASPSPVRALPIARVTDSELLRLKDVDGLTLQEIGALPNVQRSKSWVGDRIKYLRDNPPDEVADDIAS